MLIKPCLFGGHRPVALIFCLLFAFTLMVLYPRRGFPLPSRIKVPSIQLGLERLSRLGVHSLQAKPKPHPVTQQSWQASALQDDLPTHYQSARGLWTKLRPLLDKHDPGTSVVKAVDPIDFAAYDPDDTEWTKDLLNLETDDLIKMRDAHQGYIQDIKRKFGTFKASANAARRGIVLTASQDYLPVLMVTLRMLMRTKSTLPVEVWINRWEEYEENFCEKAISGMNVRCHVLEEIFMHEGGKHKPSKKFVKFEYKIFAILFSSFQEVMYLDADSFPLHPPEELFDNDPYRRTGMVLWPDIWRESISPSYYLINNLRPHHRGRRAATESGQMMFNKKIHFHTLLLVAYYNYHGESHYYSLLSQNGPGRGDKDMFTPAADTLGMSYWQVREPVATVGHDFGGLGYWVLAMVQWDPAQDFHRHRDIDTGNKFNRTFPGDEFDFDSFDDKEPPRIFFMHCNSRKWNPKDVLEFLGGYDLAWDLEGNPMRAYADPPELAERLKWTERAIWDEVKWIACEPDTDFKNWEGTKAEICDRIGRYHSTIVDPEDGVEPIFPNLNEDFIQWLRNEQDRIDRGEEKEAGDVEES